MYTEVKSPLSSKSSKSIDSITKLSTLTQSDVSAGPADPLLNNFLLNLKNEANIMRGRYAMSLRKICVQIYDEGTPIASLKSEIDSLVQDDKNFKRATRIVQSEFKQLRADSQAKYPLTDAESFIVNPHYGLPTTHLLTSIVKTEADLVEYKDRARSLYGAVKRQDYIDLTNKKMLPDHDRSLLRRYDTMCQKKDRFYKSLDDVNENRGDNLDNTVASKRFTTAFLKSKK